MRLLGYARVSTEDQAATGVSLAAQAERLRMFADLYGHQLVAVVSDVGSAKDMRRPALADVLARLRAGDADGLLVFKLDRLTRSLRDLLDLLDEFFAAGAQSPRALLSVQEQIDTSTATGRMMVNLMMVIAQWERETIGERTREALRHKKVRGERVGGVPYGWKVGGDGRTLVPDAKEREAVCIARSCRRDGMSLRAIGEVLWARGYRQRNGGRWRPQTVKGLLAAGGGERRW